MGVQVCTLGTAEADRWRETLQRCGTYDVYHLPEYHLLAEEQQDARAVLFVCETQSVIMAMPMLLREIEGLASMDISGYRDVTSVYGYPGPVSTVQHPSDDVTLCFASSLQSYLESERAVAAFSRLHPFFDQEPYLRDLGGQVQEVGATVVIDLSLPAEAQRRQYRSNHKRDIKKARREGVTCVHDEDCNYLHPFVEMYHETMRRTGASEYYFFDRTYFARLLELLGDYVHLFVAIKEGVVLSGALFTLCNSIIQYHLGGTDSRYLSLAPSKLIFDSVRLWGTEIGARIFHLGGGVRSRQDSLFRFKAGFSKLRYRFRIWKMVVDPEAYSQLVEQKRAWNEATGVEVTEDSYFPAYRCPTRPVS